MQIDDLTIHIILSTIAQDEANTLKKQKSLTFLDEKNLVSTK